MIVDFSNLDDDISIDADLCIIGAGPAGITIAREFIGTGVRVCLLESGGEEPEEETQDLCVGENVGRPYFDLDTVRIRTLGGTTFHWEGQCAPLTSTQFEARDWVPHSGWPISRSEIDPYYIRAHDLCELGDFDYGPENWKTLKISEPEFNPAKVVTRFWKYSPPTRFGPKYAPELKGADNLIVYLNASVIDIGTSGDTKTVQQVDVRSLGGKTGKVSAKVFVLACGGLDNPRMLLSSNRIEPHGLGNRHDLVGRFFMEHLSAVPQDIVATDTTKLVRMFAKSRQGNTPVHAGLCPSDQSQRENKILSSSMSIESVVDMNSGVGTAKSLVLDLKDGRMPDDLASKVWRVLSDLDEVIPASYRRTVMGEPLVAGIKSMFLMSRSEQAPNPDSRVTLSNEKDALGMNRVQLDWRLTDLDKHTLRVFSRTLASELGRLDLARVKLPEWLSTEDNATSPNIVGGFHHMGTTRMADDPKKGVVDRNCQIHGVGNLYVAGSSVFPTSGYANPTLTIVALSLRLADFLKASLAQD
jgi:choline dehydrogenase-like flavoprotein